MISTIYDFLTGIEEHLRLSATLLTVACFVVVTGIIAYNSKKELLREEYIQKNLQIGGL